MQQVYLHASRVLPDMQEKTILQEPLFIIGPDFLRVSSTWDSVLTSEQVVLKRFSLGADIEIRISRGYQRIYRYDPLVPPEDVYFIEEIYTTPPIRFYPGQSWSHSFSGVKLYEIWHSPDEVENVEGTILVTLTCQKDVRIYQVSPFSGHLITISIQVMQSPIIDGIHVASAYAKMYYIGFPYGFPSYALEQDVQNMMDTAMDLFLNDNNLTIRGTYWAFPDLDYVRFVNKRHPIVVWHPDYTTSPAVDILLATGQVHETDGPIMYSPRVPPQLDEWQIKLLVGNTQVDLTH